MKLMTRLAVAGAAALLLAGCGGSPKATDSASAECVAAFQAASQDSAGDPEVWNTLTACSTVDEWTATLKEYPKVFYLDQITDEQVAMSLQVACSDDFTRGICPAALDQGLITKPGS